MNIEKPLDVLKVYALLWRWLSLTVHRYGSSPSGEVLVVMTMIILDRCGYQPTVTELADITQLPKSSISRYVSSQMTSGMLEEFIDPDDRRRRRLRPTDRARAELKWQSRQLRTIYDRVDDLPLQARNTSGGDVAVLLQQMMMQLVKDVKTRDSQSD